MIRPLRIAILVSVVVVAAMSIAFVATASHLEVTDPDDTRGPLDVRAVESFGATQPIWKIMTFASWSRAEIWDTGYVTVWLDTRAGPQPDYYVLVGSLARGLYADLWRDRATKPDRRIAGVKAWRADDASVSVKLPLDRMIFGNERTFYGWWVETLFTGERCRRVCFDLAPDQGAVVEPLPVPSPTVTITPSPSPTG